MEDTTQPLNYPTDEVQFDNSDEAASSRTPAALDKCVSAVKDIRSAPLSKLVVYMRVANVATASLMVASAVLSLLTAGSLSTIVIGTYLSAFGCLLCCFEAHLKSMTSLIAGNFGFMYTAKGRFVFLVLLSILCFTLNLIGKITGVLLVCTALLNLYVILKFPDYEQETLAADQKGQGNDISGLAASAFTGYARENPEAVAAAVAGGAKWAYEHPEVAQSAQAAAWSAHPASASPQGHLGVESSVV